MVGNAVAELSANKIVPKDRKNWFTSQSWCGTMIFVLYLSSKISCITIKKPAAIVAINELMTRILFSKKQKKQNKKSSLSTRLV